MCRVKGSSVWEFEQTSRFVRKRSLALFSASFCPTERQYRGASIIRNSAPLGPYRRNMPRALWRPSGGGLFLMSEAPHVPVQGGGRSRLSAGPSGLSEHEKQTHRGPSPTTGPHARPFVGVFQKSILDRFVIFWRLFPSKWLQHRPQIPKPSPGITPRRAFCGTRGRLVPSSKLL